MAVILWRRIEKFDDISFENVNEIVKGTTSEDNGPYIINLLKSLFKLGVSIGILRIDSSFRITIDRDIPEPGYLEIVEPSPEDSEDPYNTEVLFDEIEYYNIIFFKDTVVLRLDYSSNNTCHELLEDGLALSSEDTLNTIINDINIIFNYREKRCLKWRTPLIFRYVFASEFGIKTL